MIQALVVDCLVDIFDRRRHGWLAQILEHGFCGFAQMTNEELRRELRRRRLDLTALTPRYEFDEEGDTDEGLPFEFVHRLPTLHADQD